MERTVKETVIRVQEGDITEIEVSAVVNPANNLLVMGGGVAGAIRRKGGQLIEDEAKKQSPVKIGDAVITGAGSLPARWVIHAALMGSSLKTDAEKIRRAVLNTLTLADEKGISSLAFPAFGTGVGRFPVEESARIMIDEVVRYIGAETGIRTIIFVLFDQVTCDIFDKVLEATAGER